MDSKLKKVRQALQMTTAFFLTMQIGIVGNARAQNADAEVHITGSSPITCVQKRKPAIGRSGFDMEVRCSAQVSGIIKYVYPADVRYKITARIDSRGYSDKDLPPGEEPFSKDGLTAAGTGQVTVPISVNTTIPIEPWNKDDDYCRPGNFPASIVLSVAVPIGDDGESNYGDVRDTTINVTCAGG